MSNIVIGVDQGSYSVANGTRQITLSGLSFTPTVESLLYLFNTTQDKQYFAQAETYAKTVTITPSGSNYILEYTLFDPLVTGDKLHIQFWLPSSYNRVSTNNSTVVPLAADTGGADHIFTGTSEDVTDVSEIRISVATDVASATDGLQMQFSKDGTNWDWTDSYSILTPSFKEEISVSPSAQYFRIVYTNSTTIQSYFRLSVLLKSVRGKPSSHRIKDVPSEQDDVELMKSVMSYQDTNDGTINNVSIQNPFPVDGDSVYAKDIWETQSAMGDFSGSVTDLFDNLHSVSSNITSDNPKTLIIHFNRTIISNVVGLGCYGGGNFSNLKIEIGTSGGGYVTVYDDSADNTKYTTLTAQLPVTAGFNALRLTFHTTDTICLSNIVIPKTRSVVARLQAAKPDNTVTDINATAGGNLKISLEELESDVSTNSNTQLNTSPYPVDEFGNYSHLLGDNMFKGAIIAIPPEHHEIHCGDSYEASYTSDLSNGASLAFSVVIPNEGLSETNPGDSQGTKQYHTKIALDVEAEMTVDIYEGSTLSNDGTPISIFNRNRNSTFTDYIGFNHTPTITTNGTLFYNKRLGSGKSVGGSYGRESEWILKDNTKYLIVVTNATTSNNYFNLELDYYVHPGV